MNCQLVNHQDIYTLFYHGDTQGAIRLFQSRANEIEYTPATRKLYLSSLNFGIYNYILFKQNISLHECCMENEKKISLVTPGSFVATGSDIIMSYCMDVRYLIEKHSNPHIKNALYYIHTHISEPLSLKAVSEIINLNPTYLCQLFKKEVHTGFCDYVLLRRLKLAKELLLHSNDSIEKIAEQCGFKNHAYFSTCYRKYFGISPSQERN